MSKAIPDFTWLRRWYSVFDKELEHIFEKKDLGVIMDSIWILNNILCQKWTKLTLEIMALIGKSFTEYLFKKLYVLFFLYDRILNIHRQHGPYLTKYINTI